MDVQARYLALLEDWFVAEHREEVEALKRRVEALGDGGFARRGAIAGRSRDHRSGSRNTGDRASPWSINPVLSPEETAALFEAAWGEQAPDSPPALDRCLAHVGAYDGGRLVGFVKLAWDGGDHAFVLDTTVHPDHQRRGIGRRLVERAAEIARRSDVEWLHVDYEPAPGGILCPVRLPADPGRADAAEGRVTDQITGFRTSTPKVRSIQATPKAVKSWASNRYDLAAPTRPVLPCPAARYASTMASK